MSAGARARRRAPGPAGQASVLLVGALIVALAFVGLAADGSRLLLARRDLQSLADGAALAGASALDEAAYRDSAGSLLRLDPDRARAEAWSVLAAAGVLAGTDAEVHATADRVEVALRRRVTMTVLRIAGVGSQTVGARAAAVPVGR